jgi:hypothetical protein
MRLESSAAGWGRSRLFAEPSQRAIGLPRCVC